jgi:hypothetical protein
MFADEGLQMTALVRRLRHNPPGRQKSRRYGFFSFHDLRQRIPQKVEKS